MPSRKPTIKMADMPRKPDQQFTPARKERYLEYVREHGTLTKAAAWAGVTPQTVDNHRKSDPVFKVAEDNAKNDHTDMLIEAAKERAVFGKPRPLIGGKNKDRVVAEEQVYSDGLLQTLLRARSPAFGAQGVAGTAEGAAGGSNGGGVLIVPQAPHSVTEWELLYSEKAKGLTNHPNHKNQ